MVATRLDLLEVGHPLDDEDVLGALREVDDGGSVTDQLVADGQQVICWTCGSQVQTDQIERTVSPPQDAHSERVDEHNDLRSYFDEVKAGRKHIGRTREERRQVIQQLDEVESVLEDRTSRIDEQEARTSDLEDEVGVLEAEAGAGG